MSIPPVDEYGYDIRVVRFVKSAESSRYDADCICLGHFDYVKFDVLHASKGEDSPLKLIGDDRKEHAISEDNHEFPLYLLKKINADPNHNPPDPRAFWNESAVYISIVRLHCDLPYGNGLEDTTLADYLAKQCKAAKSNKISYDGKNKCLVFAQDSEHSFAVHYQFYDSLELGDAVAVLKSNSLVACLEAARIMYGIEHVRDTYTYCTIRKDILLMDESSFSEFIASQIPEITLPYATTRFSVKNAHNADAFFKRYFQNADLFYITGTADVLYDIGTCSERDFLRHIRVIALSIQKDPIDTELPPDRLHISFDDVITRVGLEHKTSDNVTFISDLGVSKETIKRLNEIKDFIEELKHTDTVDGQIIHRYQYPWRNPMIRLLGTLSSMATNFVMDDLSNLLLPSVSAIIKRIKNLKTRNQLTAEHSKEILDFLDNWTHLSNDITHLESQLAQRPELSTMRFFIPAMVLQFEQEFVKQCSKVLCSDSVNHEESGRFFIPMLVPTQDRDVSTICPLDPRQEEYVDECPLRTKIPLTMLYNPWIVAQQLCHEVAHYCGGDQRLRKERKDVLCKCVAISMARIWDSYMNIQEIDRPDYLFRKQQYLQHLASSFSKLFDQDEFCYLSVVHEELKRQIDSIYRSDDHFRNFQDSMLNGLPLDKQLLYITNNAMSKDPTSLALIAHEVLPKQLAYIVSLCKECYADLAMIILLDCSLEDYIQCVYDAEMTRIISQERNWKKKSYISIHIDRFALVCSAMQHISPNYWDISVLQTEWQREAQKRLDVLTATSGFWNGPEFMDYALSVMQVQELIEYLKKCACKLHEFINLSDKATGSGVNQFKDRVVEIRRILSAVKDNSFDWKELQRFLRKSQGGDISKTNPQI